MASRIVVRTWRESLMGCRERKRPPLTEEQRRLVERHLGLVDTLTSVWCRKLSRRVTADEIRSALLHGLTLAASLCDPTAPEWQQRAYMSRSAVGHLLDWLRQQRWFGLRREMQQHSLRDPQDPHGAPADELAADQLDSRDGGIGQAFCSLRAAHRFVLRKTVLGDWRVQDVADHLGVSTSRVSQLRAEALAELREALVHA